MLTWDQLDWRILDRLRDGFLSGRAAAGPYWQTAADLAHYDLTYAERIGWKWDAALGELRRRGWQAPPGPVLDWGCGSGIAGRRFLAAWPTPTRTLRVWDHSPLAREFALTRARETFPGLEAAPYSDETPIAVLLLSHVLNELDAPARTQLDSLLARAESVIWIEPGTPAVSRDLLTWRERVRQSFRLIAPCPHQDRCGLLVPERERDWCHHFAAPPPGIHADSQWVRFGQRAGIDLRSLPFSWLVLERPARPETAPLPAGTSRLLGRPEFFKPYARFLDCSADGVQRLTLPKRSNPRGYKSLERTKGPLLYRWQRHDTEVHGGDAVVD